MCGPSELAPSLSTSVNIKLRTLLDRGVEGGSGSVLICRCHDPFIPFVAPSGVS